MRRLCFFVTIIILSLAIMPISAAKKEKNLKILLYVTDDETQEDRALLESDILEKLKIKDRRNHFVGVSCYNEFSLLLPVGFKSSDYNSTTSAVILKKASQMASKFVVIVDDYMPRAGFMKCAYKIIEVSTGKIINERSEERAINDLHAYMALKGDMANEIIDLISISTWNIIPVGDIGSAGQHSNMKSIVKKQGKMSKADLKTYVAVDGDELKKLIKYGLVSTSDYPVGALVSYRHFDNTKAITETRTGENKKTGKKYTYEVTVGYTGRTESIYEFEFYDSPTESYTKRYETEEVYNGSLYPSRYGSTTFSKNYTFFLRRRKMK